MKKIIFSTLLAVFVVAAIALAEFFPTVIVTGIAGKWTDTRAYTDVAAAITAIGANERILIITGEEAVGTLTIPINVRLKFMSNGSLAIATQLTLETYDIDGGEHEIFSGAGDIDFAAGTVVRSAWFDDLDEALDVTLDDTLTMVISRAETLTADAVVGDCVTLRWESPLILTSGGFNLTNLKRIESGTYQIFSGAAADDFDFLAGSVVHSCWFQDLNDAIEFTEDEDVDLTILVDQSETIDFDITADEQQMLEVKVGCLITIDAGQTLTLNGGFLAEKYQAFVANGTAVFGAGAVSEIYPEWWGSNTTPGTTDMTAEIQAALVASDSTFTKVKLNGTNYLVTDTITVLGGNQLIGNSNHLVYNLQVGPIVDHDATRITFAPTAEKDLFDIFTTDGGGDFTMAVNISNMYLVGNTTGGVTHSRYAINTKTYGSNFHNLGIEQFQTGIYCYHTMGVSFRDIYIGQCSTSCVTYSTSENTNDVWDHCIFRETPWGVIIEYAIRINFQSCFWESLSIGGVNIYKECSGIQFLGGMSEDTPSGVGGANYGMFYINHDGTTVRRGVHSIIGGYWDGEDTTGPNGSFVDVGETLYEATVSIIGAYFTRFVNGIKADAADCVRYSIYVAGVNYHNVTNYSVNPILATGEYVIYGNQGTHHGGESEPVVSGFEANLRYLTLQDNATSGSATLAGMGDTLADDTAYYFGSRVAGASELYLVTMNDGAGIHEAGLFSVDYAGGTVTVVKVVGTANTAVLYTDTNLCVWPSAVGVVGVGNRLGATVNVKIVNIF